MPWQEKGLVVRMVLRPAGVAASADPAADTLAGQLLFARAATCSEAIRIYRNTGDLSLFLAGFFPAIFSSKRIGIDYAIRMGSTSYLSLARLLHLRRPLVRRTVVVYDELGKRFGAASGNEG